MASQTRSYLVVSPLPVVVEDAGISISYQPGAIFTAKNTNASVVRLLEEMMIIDVTGQSPDQGFAVIQGQIGPTGPIGPVGPQGPPGGLPAALALDNATTGNDVVITDGDAIVAQTDGGWDLGSPDSGLTPLRPATVYVQGTVDVDGTALTTLSLAGAGAFLVTSGADSNLNLTAADATPTSSNDGGTLVLTAGAGDGAGLDGKIEFRGNYTNPLVADIADGVLNFWNATANKTISVYGDPGGIRVGRNTQLTLAEGDAVFGNDGTVAGTTTGLLIWDASTQQLGIRDNANLRMIDIDGASNEIAVYEATGIRGLKVTTAGALAEFRAEDAAFRAGTDTVLDVLIRGGNAEGVENGGKLTLAAGRALGSGTDSVIQFQTGNLNRWHISETGQLLADADNGYTIGAVGASRPYGVYAGTEVIVGTTDTVTVVGDSITGSNSLNLFAGDGGVLAGMFSPSTTAFSGGWVVLSQQGRVGTAGVAPVIGNVGGSYFVQAGKGGNASGTDVGGETAADAGAGGKTTVKGGDGGTGDNGTVDAGAPGRGGDLEVIAGSGGIGFGAVDNSDGGDLYLWAGPRGLGGSGAAGTDGSVFLGTQATSQVYVGDDAFVNLTVLGGNDVDIQGGNSIDFYLGGSPRWTMPVAGHLLVNTDGGVDIGASGATRPRTLYLHTSIDVAGVHVLSSTQAGFFSTTPASQQADTAALTDSSGGTADGTVAAVSGSGADATINDNFAELTAKYNALRDLLRAYGLMA